MFAQPLVQAQIKKPSKLHATGLDSLRWSVGSPHKGPVMPKMFLFDDIIIRQAKVSKSYPTNDEISSLELDTIT